MERRQLGNSDLHVSVIGLGTWQFADQPYWGPADQQHVDTMVGRALDLGINFIDTAQGYGKSESLLGNTLRGKRDQVILATKTGGKALLPENVPDAVERSLDRLQTNYIDLFIVHWPKRDIAMDETMEALNRLRDQGKIRTIGVSNFCVPDLKEVDGKAEINSNQLPYNLFWRMIEDEIVPACRERNISITAYSPLAQGMLTGKFRKPEDLPDSDRRRVRVFKEPYLPAVFRSIEQIDKLCAEIGAPMPQVTMAWMLRKPMVASVLPGAKSLEQLEQNAGAAEVQLSDDAMEAIERAAMPAVEALGTDPDMWDMDRYV